MSERMPTLAATARNTVELAKRVIGSVGLALVKRSGVSLSTALDAWVKGDEPYSDQVRTIRPMAENVNVYRGVHWLANAAASVDMRLSRDARGGEDYIESGPAYELTRWPNPQMSGKKFWKDSAGFMIVDGEVFWIALQMNGYKPTEVVVAGRRQVKVVKSQGGRGKVIGYVFKGDDGQNVPLSTDQVRHVKDFNPYSTQEGLSALKAAQTALDTDKAAGIYNRSTFENIGEPGGVLRTEQHITKEQYQQIKEQWDHRHQGAGNAKRVAILHGGLEWQDVAKTQLDMQWADGKRINRDEIGVALGVPIEVLAGIADSNRAVSYQNAVNAWMGVIIPLLELLADEWELFAVRPYDPRAYAWFDYNNLEIFQVMRRERIKAGQSLWSCGVPMRDVNNWLDLGLPDQPWYGQGFVPMNMVPAELAGESIVTPPEGEGEEEKANGPVVREVGNEYRLSPQQAGRLWHAWTRSWRGLHVKMRAAMRRLFLAQRREILAKIEAATPADHKSIDPAKVRQIFGHINIDLVQENKQIRVLAQPLIVAALKLGGEQAVAEVATEMEFMAEHPAVQAALRKRVNKLAGVNASTYRRIKEVLAQGMEEGETVAEMAARLSKEVKSVFNHATGTAALTIATTEIAPAVNEGRQEGFKQAGIEKQQWLSARDQNVRESHAAADGQTRSLNEHFDVGGASLQFPGDPGGPAGEVINCRCTTIAVTEKAFNGYSKPPYRFVSDADQESTDARASDD